MGKGYLQANLVVGRREAQGSENTTAKGGASRNQWKQIRHRRRITMRQLLLCLNALEGEATGGVGEDRTPNKANQPKSPWLSPLCLRDLAARNGEGKRTKSAEEIKGNSK